MFGLDLVIFIGRVGLVLAAITTTAFPLLYLFVPWYRSMLGRIVMTQASALALAVVLKLVLTFFLDDQTRPYLLWVNVGIIYTIAVTSGILTYILWKIQRDTRRRRRT